MPRAATGGPQERTHVIRQLARERCGTAQSYASWLRDGAAVEIAIEAMHSRRGRLREDIGIDPGQLRSARTVLEQFVASVRALSPSPAEKLRRISFDPAYAERMTRALKLALIAVNHRGRRERVDMRGPERCIEQLALALSRAA